MISINGTKIVPTIFPDGASQVWKLPQELLDTVYKGYVCTVLWEFESEAELIWLAQLKTLLDTYTPVVHLDMPYLPYGRQDKRVDNNSTFALTAFARLLNALEFTQVSVLDAHNNPRANMIENLEDKFPKSLVRGVIQATRANCLLFPDQGATDRYSAYGLLNHWVTAIKIRNQSTGDISGIEIQGDVAGKRLLILDDIIDGGATFVGVAKAALADGAKEVHLYTTHGLYTKGIQVLRDAGIQRIFNRKGEIL